MANHMKQVAMVGNEELTAEERNLLSIAYKNVIVARRKSWQSISAYEQKQKADYEENSDKLTQVKEYRTMIEKELTELCKDVLELLENTLIPTAKIPESTVFYLKMMGDYHSYLAEIFVDSERKGASEKSLDAYKKAIEIAEKHLKSTNAVMYYWIALNRFKFNLVNTNTKQKVGPSTKL